MQYSAFKTHGKENRRRGPHIVGQYSNEYATPTVELTRADIVHGRGKISTKSTSDLDQAKEGIIAW